MSPQSILHADNVDVVLNHPVRQGQPPHVMNFSNAATWVSGFLRASRSATETR
jgi:hypothetical protein